MTAGSGNIGLDLSRVLEYRTMIQEELKELCDTAKAEDWGTFLLNLTDVLYLVFNLAQEASLETVLSAAFSLKRAANMRKTPASKQAAQHRASQLLPKEASPECVRDISSGRFTVHINRKLIKPFDFRQPNAEALVQAIKAKRGDSEVSRHRPGFKRVFEGSSDGTNWGGSTDSIHFCTYGCPNAG